MADGETPLPLQGCRCRCRIRHEPSVSPHSLSGQTEKKMAHALYVTEIAGKKHSCVGQGSNLRVLRQ